MKREFIEMFRGINMLEVNGIINHERSTEMKAALLISIVDWMMETEDEGRRCNSAVVVPGNGEEGI